MRIIDDKGMLFGKINIIDFLVILFLICSTIMFYFGYKVINKKEPLLIPEGHIRDDLGKKQNKSYIHLDSVNFIIDKINPEVLKMISIGDKEKDENGDVIGEILSLGKPEPLIYIVDIDSNKKISFEDPTLKIVPAIFKINVELKDGVLYYKDRRVMIGSGISFKTDKYQVEARCVSLEKQSDISEVKNTLTTISSNDIENQTGALESKTGALESKTGALESKTGALESKTGALESKIGALESKIGALESKIGALESKSKRGLKKEKAAKDERRKIF